MTEMRVWRKLCGRHRTPRLPKVFLGGGACFAMGETADDRANATSLSNLNLLRVKKPLACRATLPTYLGALHN
jgi:hypothetical protein